MKRFYLSMLVTFMVVLVALPVCAANEVRLKDISRVVEARSNQVMGFGLMIGLAHSGDSRRTGFTNRALLNLLSNMGIEITDDDFSAKNVAAVMVTAELPPFTKTGQRIPVVVSSIGDANSLKGGTLLQTPLLGADGNVYAIAQGPLLVGGFSGAVNGAEMIKNQPTVGRIPEGAIVEKEVPVTFGDSKGLLVALGQGDFTTAARVAKAIRDQLKLSAEAIDAATVRVTPGEKDLGDLVNFISRLENVTIVPDQIARIVVNSRTGTVVIGDRVRLSPVAVTHGNISIRIQGQNLDGGSTGSSGDPEISVFENDSKLIKLQPEATLGSLINALNEVGTTPRDLISILQALKASGALVAEIEVI